MQAHRCALGRAIEENPVGVDRFRRFARERLEKEREIQRETIEIRLEKETFWREIVRRVGEFKGKRHRHQTEKCAIVFVIHNTTRVQVYEVVPSQQKDVAMSTNEFEELAEEKSKEKHKREKKKAKKTKREREEETFDDGGEKKRRKEKKEEKKDATDDDAQTKTKKNEIHTLFFGQMPFDTKAKDILPWLKANLNRQGCGRDIGQIRMAGGDGEGTPGKQKKFKGFAFVDFTTAKAAKKAMKLHDTLFRGRPVTVERCERKTYQEPKSVRRAKKEEGKEVNTKTEGRTKREGLKVLTAPDDVEVVIKHVCENSEGTLKENDFDDRLKSFLGLLPRDVCEKAANEIRKFTTKMGNTKQIKNKGAFYMGIVRKISNACWKKKAAKDSMEEKGGGGEGKGKSSLEKK